MDPLSEMLTLTRVSGSVVTTLEAGDDWGVGINAIAGATFHAIFDGIAWLELDGHPPLRLLPGDVVLLPGGTRHRLVGKPGIHVEQFDYGAAQRAMNVDGRIQMGHGDVHTLILCGAVHQDGTLHLPLLSLLPGLIHLRMDQTRQMHHVLHLLAHEISERHSGSAAVRDRLLDVLLVHIIRAWIRMTDVQPQPASWLTALRDPLVSKALAALHDDVAREWTLADLASSVAVSRATLARRFRELVGQPPLAYLTDWRMELAAHHLRSGDEPIAAIARSVGYLSEFAFNRAFARVRGVTPGRYRTMSRQRQVTRAA